MEPKEKPHLLALKVMRLTRPSLFCKLPISCDSRDLAGNFFNHESSEDIASMNGLTDFTIGNLLMLPQSFGNIYLGETFTSYISVNNDSNQVVKDVAVKADLQTGSQRIALNGQANNSTLAELAPNASVDDVIHHEVKEIGTHILVCVVSYKTDTDEKMFFRKFFKFQVLKPLDVKTKFYNAEVESDEVYLEAQVQNITKNAMCLEKVSLDPSPLFVATQLNTVDSGLESVFGRVNCLHPQDSRQFLYCLSPRPDTRANPKTLKGVTNIGKLDIVWRTSMGDRGRLQTSQLQRMAPGYGDIRLTVEELPNVVEIDKSLNITCRIVNCCERTIDLILSMDRKCSPGICWLGISGRLLGKLEPDEFTMVQLELVPIRPGLQIISGIRLMDSFLKRSYDYDEMAQIFVEQPATDSHVGQEAKLPKIANAPP